MKQTIKYSITERQNPMRPDEADKAYANVQHNGKVDIEALSQHIRQHGSPFSEGTIAGVITDAAECICECLLDGLIVQLGKLGTLRLGLSCEGASAGNGKTAAENFTADNIKKVNFNFEVGEGLKVDREAFIFQYMPTLAQQAAVKAAAKAGESTVDISGDSNSGGDGGSNDNVSGD